MFENMINRIQGGINTDPSQMILQKYGLLPQNVDMPSNSVPSGMMSTNMGLPQQTAPGPINFSGIGNGTPSPIQRSPMTPPMANSQGAIGQAINGFRRPISGGMTGGMMNRFNQMHQRMPVTPSPMGMNRPNGMMS